MKRKELITELERENKTRERVYPQWIGQEKISREVAQRRLTRTKLMESIFRVMTDEEFTNLTERLEIKIISQPTLFS